MSLTDILSAHDGEIESITSAFSTELDTLLSRARVDLVSRLGVRLQVVDGKILSNASNRALLRRVDKELLTELDQLGLRHLIDAFVAQFGGQFKYFDQVLRATLGRVEADILSMVNFSVDDRQFLGMMQGDAARGLEDLVAASAGRVRSKTLLGIGGLNPKSLAALIVEELEKTPGQAKGMAATAVSTFYRTLGDLGFKKIEEDRRWTVLYRYVGPPASDPVIREFCKHLMAASTEGRTWTRDQIDAMDNGQLDNAFVTGGGYNCRHSWVVADVVRKKV